MTTTAKNKKTAQTDAQCVAAKINKILDEYDAKLVLKYPDDDNGVVIVTHYETGFVDLEIG